jgi:ribosomal protein L19E
MAEYGEWGMKGATLTDATAQKEYGVSRDFIAKAIRDGRLEFREASMWGNPCIRILRSQLEKYIGEQKGEGQLQSMKTAAELRKIDKEIRALKKKLVALQARKAAIEGEAAEE